MKVLFIGRGKVARALQAQLRKTDHPSRLIPSRGRLPDLGDDVDLVVLCVRDDALDALIGRLVAQRPSRARRRRTWTRGAFGPRRSLCGRRASPPAGELRVGAGSPQPRWCPLDDQR